MDGGGAPEAPAQPTWPAVLTFLQQEYRRFELERSEHALELASLKLRISTLEAERAQQEKHKLDLQRRVKMLEAVLDAERKKNASPSGAAPAVTAADASANSATPSASGQQNGAASASAAKAAAAQIAPSDLSAAKRKSVLKAYVERFERLESLFVLPDLPPLSIPIPVPEVVSLQQVEEMPKMVVREAVFTPAKSPSTRRADASSDTNFKAPDSPGPASPAAPSSPARTSDGSVSPSARASPSSPAPASEQAEYRKWSLRGALRGHLDEVNDVAWHTSLPILVSASADCTLKCWNIASIYRKGDRPVRTEDFDAMHTYRGHSDQVLAAAFANDNSCILSAGADSLVMVWSLPPIPPPEEAPYIARGAGVSYLKRRLEGHTDVVWDVAAHPSASVCISASADGTVKIWKYAENKSLVSSLVHPQSKVGRHTPTSVEVMRTDNRKLLVGYSSGTVVVFDMQTEKVLQQISDVPQAAHAPERQVNQVMSHAESKSLLFTAHEDKTVKYWDAASGRCVFTLPAHEDAVTGIALDPHAPRHFATVSHDASLRFWNLATRACTQEVPSVGLKKSDMALHAVSMSPFKLPLAAVACADSTVKLYT